MNKITIQIQGLDEVNKGLDRMSEAVIDELQEAIRKSGEMFKQKARRIAGSPPIVFRGELARSIQNRVGKLRAEIRAFGSAEVYSDVIEYGRRPGKMPPVHRLEHWARIKLGQEGLGFVIARKIARKGTKAQPYIRPAFEDGLNDVQHFLNEAASNVVKAL